MGRKGREKASISCHQPKRSHLPFKVLQAKNRLMALSSEAVTNGAAGQCHEELSEVKKWNNPVINGGPRMEVKLTTPVKPPCNSPCASSATWLDIMD